MATTHHITLDNIQISFGASGSPATITGEDRDTGQKTEVKAWPGLSKDGKPSPLDAMQAGESYVLPVYSKEYNGRPELLVSSYHEVMPAPNGADASARNAAAIHGFGAPPVPTTVVPPTPAPAPEPARTTPQGVMTASLTEKDTQIMALALLKSVIAIGGTPVDVDPWVEKFKQIVSQK
jgi:hypothetical protein